MTKRLQLVMTPGRSGVELEAAEALGTATKSVTVKPEEESRVDFTIGE